MSIDNLNHFDKYHYHVHYHQNHNHHHARKDRNLGSLNGFTMFYQRYPKVTLTAFDSPQCESCQDRFEFEASRSLLDEEGGTSRRDLARPGFTALLWHSQLLIWFVLIYFDLGSTYSTSILLVILNPVAPLHLQEVLRQCSATLLELSTRRSRIDLLECSSERPEAHSFTAVVSTSILDVLQFLPSSSFVCIAWWSHLGASRDWNERVRVKLTTVHGDVHGPWPE